MRENDGNDTRCVEGRSIEFIGLDGVKRVVGMARVNGQVQIDFKTWWDDEQAEPFATGVRLSTPALNAMMQLLMELRAYPELFPNNEL